MTTTMSLQPWSWQIFILTKKEFELTITNLFAPSSWPFSLFWGNCLYCSQSKSCDYRRVVKSSTAKFKTDFRSHCRVTKPSLRGWGVEKMFVSNSLTGDVWVILFGWNNLTGEEWVNLSWSGFFLSFRVDFHCLGKVARKPQLLTKSIALTIYKKRKT